MRLGSKEKKTCGAMVSISDGSIGWGLAYTPTSRCIQEEHPIQRIITRNDGTYIATKQDETKTGCYKMVCQDSELYIDIMDQTLRCPSGGYVYLVDDILDGVFLQGALGPCPDNGMICRSLGCPENCNGNGHCWDGVCHCHIGYTGERSIKFAF